MTFSIESGLEKLEELITNQHYLILQADITRLKKVVEDEHLFGRAPQTTQEKFQVIDTLNWFLLENYDQTFTDLCK